MIEIKAEKRDKKKKLASKLRENGYLPVVLYGRGLENVLLKVKDVDFQRLYREMGQGNQIFKVAVEGEKELRDVLLHDIQKDPLSGRPIHADFYQVKAGQEIEQAVPLVFVGEAPAVKELGGILVKYLHEIEVKSLPRYLPPEIEVSVDNLKTFEDFIRVADLNIPKEVQVLSELDEMVAAVVEPKEEKEEQTESTEGEVAAKESAGTEEKTAENN